MEPRRDTIFKDGGGTTILTITFNRSSGTWHFGSVTPRCRLQGMTRLHDFDIHFQSIPLTA
ncbi:hypothetical protein [Nannocystis pusilla]|uniref:hypothetical protein n=1 Tax=Nannocystis pusilla TaxID=889268 RepID=UPI003DA684A5